LCNGNDEEDGNEKTLSRGQMWRVRVETEGRTKFRGKGLLGVKLRTLKPLFEGRRKKKERSKPPKGIQGLKMGKGLTWKRGGKELPRSPYPRGIRDTEESGLCII